MRALSLHHLVALDVPACELVRIASALRCRHVCLFTQDPNAGFNVPVVRDRDVAVLRLLMDEHGVTALGVASFAMTPEVDVSLYDGALRRGAELGASCTSVRIQDRDEARATDNFGEFCRMASRHGIEPAIEFMGYGAVDALPQAMRIIEAAGGRGKISLDTLHAVRSGTPMVALRRLDPSLIGYFQMSDGPLAAHASHYAREGAFDRLPPGDGEFPLREILDIVPGHLPISLEVPTHRWRAQGVVAAERARRVVQATRRLLSEPPLAN